MDSSTSMLVMIDTVIVIVIVCDLTNCGFTRHLHSTSSARHHWRNRSSLITPRCWGAKKKLWVPYFHRILLFAERGTLVTGRREGAPYASMTSPLNQGLNDFLFANPESIIPSLFTTGTENNAYDQCQRYLNDSSVESLRLVIAHKTSSDTGTVPSHKYGGPSTSVGLRKD